ncbi:MAG TPA: cytochrome c oxidase assembly protein [Candidatus Binatia bacterium]|jgi:Cytochrome c oxidase assembly protein CtaG/Cox11|nr:cytochrome c oxidase assembly protein [Candidatus Binatia bacterium]
MRPRLKIFFLLIAAVLLLSVPISFLLKNVWHEGNDGPVWILTQYLRAVYSRDFKQAYRFVSAEDKRLKDKEIYVRERGPFTGFALEAAKKLSELIEFTPAQIQLSDDRARIVLAFKAPDMNSIGALLLDWNEERLQALSLHEQKKLLAAIGNLQRDGRLEVIEGQEEFTLRREGYQWRLFFDWASGVKVKFGTLLPENGLIEAKPTIKETVIQPNELFTIAYRVKNLTDKEVFARITHRVEPAALTDNLDVVECGLLLPVRILPGEEQTYSSTYLIRGDIPDGTKSVDVTYEFKVEP